MTQARYPGPPPPTERCSCYRGNPPANPCEHLCGEPCDCPEQGGRCLDCVETNLRSYYDWRVKMIKLYHDVALRTAIEGLRDNLPALKRAINVRDRRRHAYPCRWAECQNRVIRSWGYYEWPKVEFCFECQKKGRGDNS